MEAYGTAGSSGESRRTCGFDELLTAKEAVGAECALGRWAST
jgi:hypothetical protein